MSGTGTVGAAGARPLSRGRAGGSLRPCPVPALPAEERPAPAPLGRGCAAAGQGSWCPHRVPGGCAGPGRRGAREGLGRCGGGRRAGAALAQTLPPHSPAGMRTGLLGALGWSAAAVLGVLGVAAFLLVLTPAKDAALPTRNKVGARWDLGELGSDHQPLSAPNPSMSPAFLSACL